ncbi:Asp23/Gls24 family envelope stress response protein [Streptomyces monashensis]|uniref:Asp23/Gls24 family envelope stress response protein n=1 Tax=Streptomyces monashensis TaxID=1678012 RepID=A0A1S2QG84_9ACTN|nr:Asp23/Gls24 family envelope stress response protein [Streptomyces monashensis]OIK04677.1 hypothetical protein BIV23_16670 [Streptomyces monashensis]
MSAETGVPRPRPALAPPGERGALRIADRVVAKIAARAAREALPPPPADAAAPHATVVRHADVARVQVHLELGYPCDIGAHSAAVRRHVAQRVSALVDMEVTEVAVRIERLHPAPAPGAVPGRA